MRKRVWICDVLGPYVCVGLVWERKGCAADARVGRAGVLCVRAAVAGSEPVRECLCSGCRGRAGAVAARGRLCGVLDVLLAGLPAVQCRFPQFECAVRDAKCGAREPPPPSCEGGVTLGGDKARGVHPQLKTRSCSLRHPSQPPKSWPWPMIERVLELLPAAVRPHRPGQAVSLARRMAS